jgi:ubiquinone biosynthesis protein UbiJ
MNIIGEGEWFIDVSASGPACKPGTQGTADCTITIGAEDFLKLLENPQAHGMSLYSTGKLQIAGDAMLALQLQKVFSYV